MKADEFIISRLNDVFDERISSRIFKSSAVREAANTFRDSLQQIVNLQAMPGWVAGAMYELGNCWADACEQITGKRVWPKERWHERDVYEQIIAAHHSISSERKSDLQHSFRMPDLHLLHVEHMNPEIPLASGFEAITKAAFIYCWSSFEVLAQALYVASHGREPNKRFSVIWNIRNEYEAAYSLPDGAQVHRVIKSDEFLSVALLRNLIVHKAGVIDQKFLCDSSPVLALDCVRSLGLNSKVHFGSKLIADFISPFIEKSCDLIDAVDAWP